MPIVETRSSKDAGSPEDVKPSSVLVILVVKDGAPWLRRCLLSLAKQTYPRISVLAVDNASTDGSVEALEGSLGAERVIRLEGNQGFARALTHGLASKAAREADHLLLVHDDVALAPDAISTLVQEAERNESTGVVGPKVLDWKQPRILRDIGQSSDRFGYPYSTLEDGEIDHGQYQRAREVLFVSSCAMLVSREAWTRIGLLDERLDSRYDALDFCWRARLAGFRVLMIPSAVARHRGASATRERPGADGRARDRYYRERAAFTSMLKNYSLISLLWILPLYLLQGVVRVVMLAISRRFEDAYQVLAAWGWNAVHLPGTVRRRVRVQAARAVRDREVHRFMAPAGIRLRKWAVTAGEVMLPRRQPTPAGPRPTAWTRAKAFASVHPVLVACLLAGVLCLIAYRGLLGANPLFGGSLATFPSTPSGFFQELTSGLRSTGLGGSHPATPALGLLGIGSLVTLGSPALLQKFLLLGLPVAAGVGCYRSIRFQTGVRLAAVLSAAAYALSAVVLWAFSDGRIPFLVLLAGLPWLFRKFPEAFAERLPGRPVRWIAGAGLGLAVLVAFYPGTLVALILIVAASVLIPGIAPGRLRGLVLSVVATAAAGLLAMPLTVELLREPGGALADLGGIPSFAFLARLAPGPGPGAWPLAIYLPLSAGLALIFVSPRFSRAVGRSILIAVASTYLAWLGAAGHLPSALTNPPALVGLAAVAYANLVGLGLASVLGGVGRAAFGGRQLAAALMAGVVAAGVAAQAFQAARGNWTVGGPGRLRASYLAVSDSTEEPFRVLWLGKPGSAPFPAPGGGPEGTVAAGSASVRFAVRGPGGASMLDVGRPAAGPGYDSLRRDLAELLAGDTRHGGSLLAPLGVRFVVGAPTDLPGLALARLADQLDLDRVPAADLTIFQNAKWVPLAARVDDAAWSSASRSDAGSAVAALPVVQATPLAGSGPRLTGSEGSSAGIVLLAQEFDPRWRLRPTGGGLEVEPHRSFGWALGFAAPDDAGPFEVRFHGQSIRAVQIAGVAALWLAALWITRRPVRRG